jgi:two-component system, response regulator PdtaR
MNSVTTGRGKILVVDDDRLVLATLVHGLSQAGFEVLDADNGDDAILLAREHRPDLALLDIRMEGKSGFDVAAYLREYCQTPFMFLSAFSDEATVKQVKALGAVAYLIKPLDIGQIVPAVEAALAQVSKQPPAAPRAASTAAAATDIDTLPTVVAMAVGVLMHRHGIDRVAALTRLNRMAEDQGHAPAAQAQALLNALEVLARSGPA